MANFNELREKLLVKLGNAADNTKDFAEKAADKAKVSGKIAKLTMEIAGEKDSMKKTYIEIGKLYYDTHKDDPEGFFIQLCEEVSLAHQSITAKEAEIEELKTEKPGDIEVDFEEIVSEEECCACSCEGADFAEEAAAETEDKAE